MHKITFLITSLFVILIFQPEIVAQSLEQQLSDKIDIVVSKDSNGDYKTIQEAIDAVPDNSSSRTLIYIKSGIYTEKIVVPVTKTNLYLIGEDVDSSIISYNDHANKTDTSHTFNSYTFRADAENFFAMNLTFQNTAGDVGQAVAFHSNGDKQTLFHCRFIGWQDTYYNNIRTRNYLKDCFIEGAVDYIFGFGVTLFDSCQIHTVRNSGYITAASTSENYRFGYVFKNCRITSDKNILAYYLGRPWFPYAKTVFYNCWEHANLNEKGWHDWSGKEDTCYYREYNCYGPGSDTSKRVWFGKQLLPEEAPIYTRDTIFSSKTFPSGPTADEDEINAIIKHFAASDLTDMALEFMRAGMDTFPELPSTDWLITLDTNSIYNIIKENTIPFLDSSYAEYEILNILYDGADLPGFDTSKTIYGVEIPDTTQVAPEVVVISEKTFVTIEYPETLPAFTSVIITSKDKVNSKEFLIYNSIDSAYWNADIDYIVINQTDTIYLQHGVYNYNFIVSEDVTSILRIKPISEVKGVSYLENLRPQTIPGQGFITSIANDEETTREYTFNFAYTSGLRNNSLMSPFKIQNPFHENINIRVENQHIKNFNFSLYSIDGKLVYQKRFEQPDKFITISSSSIKPGLYIYTIDTDDYQTNGRLIKQ